jgi:exosortase/archaeosortase family protein
MVVFVKHGSKLGENSAFSMILLYAITLPVLALTIYYLPDYSTLEAMIAEHSAGVLNAIGIAAATEIIGKEAYVNNVQIVRECTGIQVMAIFAGLLLPLPKVNWQTKLRAIALLSFAVYVANVMRIAFELWLLDVGILPWDMAHGPVGAILGVVTVFMFFLIADRFIPEIGTYLNALADWITNRFKKR